MTEFALTDLTVRRGDHPVVAGVSFDLKLGGMTGLIGPNGAGKTTLMRAALGLLPCEGSSTIAAMPARDRARVAAWLPQERDIAWPVNVETLVALGRTPYLAAGRKLSSADRASIASAIERMDLQALTHRKATELSGGEKARALIARVLAQDTPIVLADEPVAGLDPSHQIAAMKVFRTLAHEDKTVLVSLHDLGLASRYCDRIILLDRGRAVADGPPSEVLNTDLISAVFHVGGHWADTPEGRVFQVLEGVDR